MANEKIKLLYKNKQTWGIGKQNDVGPTDSLITGSVTAYDDTTCKHVRKSGDPYLIKSISDAVITTPRSTSSSNAWQYEFRAVGTNTLLGYVKDQGGTSTFVAGFTLSVAQAVYIKVVQISSMATVSITDNDTIVIDTDVDPAGYTITLPAESYTYASMIWNGLQYLKYYLTTSGSVYYDSTYMHPAKLHTPDGTAALPYFTISDAVGAIAGAFTIITILDSMAYDEKVSIPAGVTLQAALGETPSIVHPRGARTNRSQSQVFNNSNSVFLKGTTGSTSSSASGNYHNPVKTLTLALSKVSATKVNIVILDAYNFAVPLSVNNANLAKIEGAYGITPAIQSIALYRTVKINGLNIRSGITFAASWNGEFNDCTMESNINMNAAFAHIGSWVRCVFNPTATTQMTIKPNVSTAVTDGAITDCVFIGSGNYGIQLYVNPDVDIDITGCVFTGHYVAILFFNNTLGASTYNLTGSLYNCHIMEFSSVGVYFFNRGSNIIASALDIKNCLVVGVDFTTAYAFNSTASVGPAKITGETFTYCAYSLAGADWVVGAGAVQITTKEQVYIDIDNGAYGLPFDSTARLIGDDGDDAGVHDRMVTILGDSSAISNITIDGNENGMDAIWQSADRSGTVLSNLWIKGFNGHAWYDFAAAPVENSMTDCIVSNCGAGIYRPYSGDTTQDILQSLFFKNTGYAIYCNNGNTIFNHCTFHGNGYGIYFDTAIETATIQNSIFSRSEEYGIYNASTTVSLLVSNSCVYDQITDNVLILPFSFYYNITFNPLFVNVEDGTEDFTLMRKDYGYTFDSPCVGGGSDSEDQGAYLYDSFLEESGWKEYTFERNPRKIEFQVMPKGLMLFDDALGNVDTFMSDTKRRWVFEWTPDQGIIKADRLMVEYLFGLCKNRKKRIEDNETVIRIAFLPTAHIDNGTGVVDGDAKTITDALATWIPNELKGYRAAVVLLSGASMVIDATAKTGTFSGAFATDAYLGRWLIIPGKPPIYIKSNTDAGVFTLSDEYGNLESETAATFEIVDFYKIDENEETVLSVLDPDGTLPTESFSYWIDYIEARIIPETLAYSQSLYNFEQEANKNGFRLLLEEV